jgi:hypothetical protein
MNFQRGIDPKQALNVGWSKKLPQLMKNSGYDYKNYWDVWEWALKNKKDWVFPYIVSLKGKPWYGGEIVDLSNWNNEMLWTAIEEGRIEAIKALMIAPDLFREETLTEEEGTSTLNGEYVYRGESKFSARATNLGVFIGFAEKNVPEAVDILRDYLERNRKK